MLFLRGLKSWFKKQDGIDFRSPGVGVSWIIKSIIKSRLFDHRISGV